MCNPPNWLRRTARKPHHASHASRGSQGGNAATVNGPAAVVGGGVTGVRGVTAVGAGAAGAANLNGNGVVPPPVVARNRKAGRPIPAHRRATVPVRPRR